MRNRKDKRGVFMMARLALMLAVMLSGLTMAIPASAETKTFVYAGGCFWCTEADSENIRGVREAISGFSGGREAVQVFYYPDRVSFEDLVRHVYRTVDYEDAGGQFCDRGQSYSAAIYYKSDAEKVIAEKLAPPTSVVPIEPEQEFYPARKAHQNFYKRGVVRYRVSRTRCGRDKRLWELNRR